jgi:hypothetical protein
MIWSWRWILTPGAILSGSIFLSKIWRLADNTPLILLISLKMIRFLTMAWSLQYILRSKHKKARTIKKLGKEWVYKYHIKKGEY